MNLDLLYQNQILNIYAGMPDEYEVPSNVDHFQIAINSIESEDASRNHFGRVINYQDPCVFRVYQAAQMRFEIFSYRNTQFLKTETLSYGIQIKGVPYKTSFFHYVCQALNNDFESFEKYHQKYSAGFEHGVHKFIDHELDKIFLMALTESQKMKNLWDYTVNRWEDLSGPISDKSASKDLQKNPFTIGSIDDTSEYATRDGYYHGLNYAAWAFVLKNQYGLREIAKNYVNLHVKKDPHLYSDLADEKILKELADQEKTQWTEFKVLTQYKLTVSELAMYFYLQYNYAIKSNYRNYTDLQKRLLKHYNKEPNTSLYQEYNKIREALDNKNTISHLDEYDDRTIIKKFHRIEQIRSEMIVKANSFS
ncbi:hypothetical protein [Nonlabens ponticola]|uniref:Uncharacterized protein n=1 Tax=Nonlabens ponticola TaxID=2496866 RepID=A0A3S9N032_9FLAO|nr:hypothetical protein [Nonlabens ponticola]AZQ44851.1 hypothetical protein EJ995_11655 [Nonlabens ponticola]